MNTDFYWLGFILADGCIYEPGGGRQDQLCVTSKDREHLEKLRKWVGTGTINEHVEGGRWLFRASSDGLCSWLRSFGVFPRKTGREVVDSRVKENVDFWRGVVDGDGWVVNRIKKQTYETKDGERKCEFKSAVLGLCGSFEVCEAFRNFMGWDAPVKKGHDNCHRIVVEAKKAREGIRRLYEDAEVSLDRKKDIAMSILGMEVSCGNR